MDLRADLTVKGATAPVPLHARARLIDDATVRLITETDINRKEFGVDGNVTGMIPAGATLTADVVFRRARA